MARRRRSLHFVPGGNERMLAKALTIPADGLILDLEDAVAPDRKAATRGMVRDWLTRDFGGRERWVPLDRISPHLVNATVASEDRRFRKHAGVDPVGVARALGLDLLRGRAAFGGSTLTMQLARLVDPHPRSLRGKLGEMVAAGRIERVLSKDEILEQYLNRVYYGHGAWGAEAAARFYFGKSVRDLSLPESALIAAIIKSPNGLSPHADPEKTQKRRDLVLELMRDQGRIEEARALLGQNTREINAFVASKPSPALSAMSKQYEGLVAGMTRPEQWNQQRKLMRQMDSQGAASFSGGSRY